MSSVSARSPTFDSAHSSTYEHTRPVRSWPTTRLYSIDNCVNCGHRYEYRKLNDEQSGDATMPWKRFSSVVSDHYYSCPKKLANIIIHQPTSAIRGTLTEPNEGKKRRPEQMKSPPVSKPCSWSPARHDCDRMEVDTPHFYDLRSTSPEPSLAVARQNTPERVESSTIAVRPQHMETMPRSPHRVLETPRGPSNRTTNISYPPSSPLNRLPPPSTLRTIADDEPTLTPLPSPHVLPPLWNRKRKRPQFQESSLADPSSSHGHPRERSNAVEVRPRSPSPIATSPTPTSPTPTERPATIEVITPARDLSSFKPYPVCADEDAEEQTLAKKEKKNVMSWERRRENMMQDQLLLKVEAKRVLCKPCQKWIKLDARNDYYPGLWIKHRRTMHSSEGGVAPFPVSERRRRSRSNDEKMAVSRKRKVVGTGRHCQEQSQESYGGNETLTTRPIRSSSRVSRSSSGSST